MTALRWGIVGTGKIASKLAESMWQVPQWAVPVAVASRSRERAEAFGARHGGLSAVVGCEALAARPDIDAIYIASPPSEHLADATVALGSDKAVLCEKPLTTSAEQTSVLANTARERGVFLMEALWTRFVPSIAKVRSLLSAGRIGEPRVVQAELGMVLDAPAGHYLRDPRRGGGVLLDVGPYAVSLATMVLGTPIYATGVTTVGPTGVDLAAGGIVHFASGSMASFLLSFQAALSPQAHISGTEGRITLAPPLFAPPALTVEDADGRAQRIDLPSDIPGWAYQLREVAKSVSAGRRESEIMPLNESLWCAHILDACRTTNKEQRPWRTL